MDIDIALALADANANANANATLTPLPSLARAAFPKQESEAKKEFEPVMATALAGSIKL